MDSRAESAFEQFLQVVACAAQLNWNVDIFRPIVAVDILLVVVGQKECLCARAQDAMNLGKGGIEIRVLIDRFYAE